jgi:hypothetical protein
MADNGRKSKLIPLLAAAAVVLVGTIGLIRGCGYAAEPPPSERGSDVPPARQAPDV